MTRLSIAAAAAALFLIPAAAAAQAAPPPAAPPPAANMRPILNVPTLEGEIARRNLDSRAREVMNSTSPGRMSRAERVAELINAGDCAGAQALAMAENDRRLARRVGEVCSATN